MDNTFDLWDDNARVEMAEKAAKVWWLKHRQAWGIDWYHFVWHGYARLKRLAETIDPSRINSIRALAWRAAYLGCFDGVRDTAGVWNLEAKEKVASGLDEKFWRMQHHSPVHEYRTDRLVARAWENVAEERNDLPVQVRVWIWLWVVEGWSFTEIAETMRVERATISSHMRKAGLPDFRHLLKERVTLCRNKL